MLQFCPCSLVLCLVSNASPLHVCNDLVQEGISGRLENCSVWFWEMRGGGMGSSGVVFAKMGRGGFVFRRIGFLN